VELLLRLGAAVAFLLIVLVAVALLRGAYRRRLSSYRGEPAAEIAAGLGLPLGRAAVVFLSTPRCVECHELQEPALARLAGWLAVEVRELHPDEAPLVTGRFNILSVPATVVLDAEHRVRAVNVGFADAEQLARQLA
jgi:hypothetical protein